MMSQASNGTSFKVILKLNRQLFIANDKLAFYLAAAFRQIKRNLEVLPEDFLHQKYHAWLFNVSQTVFVSVRLA